MGMTAAAGAPPGTAAPGRNLVVCLDGTNNEPEHGETNVVRLYDIAAKNDRQLVYYDPGVGTMGARSATTRLGKGLTQFAGLVIGFGVKDNIEEAYLWLMNTWQPGDRIYVFGFSRGAYTARALVGLLRTIGLLRAGADNLIPYALKLYTKQGKKHPTDADEKRYWGDRDDFNRKFGNPHFPNAFQKNPRQVHFLGVWDTVKSVGWLNWRARYQQAHWPFTRKAPNVEHGRHAMAIDERRYPYHEYRFDQEELKASNGRLREVWFAGVHSDVGGKFLEHGLSDIALDWLIREARAAGLLLDEARYKKSLRVSMNDPLPDENVIDKLHSNEWYWWFAGLRWHHRKIEPGDEVHPSVLQRVDRTAHTPHPYQPKLPSDQ
jgi:uncharacterized protein (DUF2235 family)